MRIDISSVMPFQMHQTEQDSSIDLSSSLANPDWALAHYTLIADLTTLRAKCLFMHSQKTVVARYNGLPFPALSFFGESPVQIAGPASQMVELDETFYLLLSEKQTGLAKKAFMVEQVSPEWQMLFTGELKKPTFRGVVSLTAADLGQMRELAANTGLMAFEESPFEHGPAFGIWDCERLVAMGCTHLHLKIPFAAAIGNIATCTTHRRRGLARQVVSALLQAHSFEGKHVFLMVFQTNQAAVNLYESMGFKRLRTMFLLRCRLREVDYEGD